MHFNRIQHFMRNIFHNGKLNREKMIKNKKIYKITNSKNNHNLIIKRKLSIHENPFPDDNKGGGPNIILLAALVVGLISLHSK